MKKPNALRRKGQGAMNAKPDAPLSEKARRALRARELLAELSMDSAPAASVSSDSHKLARTAPAPRPADRKAKLTPLRRNARAGGEASDTSEAVGRKGPAPELATKLAPKLEHLATVREVKGVVVPSPEHPLLADKHRPKNHPPGSLKFMDIVFLRDGATGEHSRMFIESAPKDWTRTAWVRLSDKPLRDDRNTWPQDRLSFCVHADMVTLAPPVRNAFHSRLPTPASVAQQERHARGERDIGDTIAVRLRACKDLPATYKVASNYLGVPVAELQAKYGKLNPGQQRMNLGNRMRNHFKKHGKGEDE